VTALCALDLLRPEGVVRADALPLRDGIKAARLEARFHIASEKPLIIYDGAHNPDGARALTRTLGELFPEGRILFVTSILRDKAAAEMLVEFSGAAAAFITTASGNERALAAAELGNLIREAGGVVLAEANDPKEAYEAAVEIADEYDAVVFAGSLYMIGEVMR